MNEPKTFLINFKHKGTTFSKTIKVIYKTDYEAKTN